MDDLISRNAIEHLVMTKSYDLGEPIQKRLMMHDVESLPSVQPKIIKCKECKHYQGEDSWVHCNRVTWLNGEDDYCRRGERKDG